MSKRESLVTASDRLEEARLQLGALIVLIAASENSPVDVETYLLASLMRPIKQLVDEACGEIEAAIG
ncbi:hypothetical protein [Nitrosovibrio sp. Nv17]|uniref:hypothetical protein n=1 Tax=Nitrosovibrio sp. Nv17 TaxID=1855339 RepID=UPI0009090B1A|nr:hypothetical protein [Nitrosovibrio sp. Nv17]SFW39611.1 hypothetical protein SAMN05216414_13413 [Nitrosovibrio sp. Nv17]